MVLVSKLTRLTRFAWIVAAVYFFVGLTVMVYLGFPAGVDWSLGSPDGVGLDWGWAFRPAALNLLHLESPYDVSAFYNPPWILLPLIPLALLPVGLGAAILYSTNILAFLFSAHKLRMHPILIGCFVLLSSMWVVSVNGNIEGLLSLGFFLPPQIGLFFVLSKPQYGIGVAAYWAFMAWEVGGWRQLVRTFLPVLFAYTLSFLLFGFWISGSSSTVSSGWNRSLFPYGIPVGVLLLFMSISKREIRYAIASSPFFSPYLTWHTWAVVWLGLLSLFVPRKGTL